MYVCIYFIHIVFTIETISRAFLTQKHPTKFSSTDFFRPGTAFAGGSSPSLGAQVQSFLRGLTKQNGDFTNQNSGLLCQPQFVI